MKKFLYIFVSLILLLNFISAGETLGQGFNIDWAKNYLLKGKPSSITAFAHTFYLGDEGVESMIKYYNNGGGQIGFLIKYSGEPNISFFYSMNNNLQYVKIVSDPLNTYPQRSYIYDTCGIFQHMDLYLSQTEYYGFNKQGNYDTHAIDGVLYNPDNEQIGTMSDIIKF